MSISQTVAQQHAVIPEWKLHYFDPHPPARLEELNDRARKAFWVPKEVRAEITTDIGQWTSKLDKSERRFIGLILAYFTTADSVLDDYIAKELIPAARHQVARMFWRFQIGIEDIHAETYMMFLEAYPIPESKKEKYRAAMESILVIKQKIEWYRQPRATDLPEKLVVQACAEMIQFSASLCGPIEFSHNRKLLPALGQAIRLIVRDEGCHGEFACEYLRIVGLPNLEWLHRTVRECVDLEMQFVDYILRTPLIGLTADSMKQYVRYVADRMLGMMGLPAIYGDANPYDWMLTVGSASKTSLHDRHPTEYQTVSKADMEEDAFADF